MIDRQRLFIGSMNLDPRSAWSNTESGLLIESPQMANQVADLLNEDGNAGIYRLRLGADGETSSGWRAAPTARSTPSPTSRTTAG